MSIRLLIDKLSLTFAISNDDQTHVLAVLHEGALEGRLRPVERYNKLRDGYKHAYLLMFDDKVFCAIQAAPIKPGNRFVRLEWNPSKAERACPDSMLRIIELLESIAPGESLRLLASANITRIDLAFDLYRVRVDSFFINTTLRKSFAGNYIQHHQEFSPHGRLNCRYIGRADSPIYLVIYDKRLEREIALVAGVPTNPLSVNAAPSRRRVLPPITRFELRLKKVGTWAALRAKPNPFANYSVVSYRAASVQTNDHIWSFFIDSCYRNGSQVALSRIVDRHERKKFADALREDSPPSWWNPETIWAQLPDVIAHTLGIWEH